ncbi:hypothetical protein ACFLT7_05760 [candidate division KSB1 bacterium]
MSAEIKPIDERLWNVVEATVRRLPSAGDQSGKAAAEALERTQTENRASSRAERDVAEDASRTIGRLKDKIITYTEDSKPGKTGNGEDGAVDVRG